MATANPFHDVYPWGDITAKESALYLFIEETPSMVKYLSGYEGRVDEVKVLGNNQVCNYTETRDGLKSTCQH